MTYSGWFYPSDVTYVESYGVVYEAELVPPSSDLVAYNDVYFHEGEDRDV